MTLRGENITVQIGDKKLVESVSLSIAPAEILAVVGPNGAGKSTLLKVLAGEMQACSGTVLMNDRPLAKWRKRDLAQIRAVLPQSSELSFGFTVQEVVLMGRIPHVRGTETLDDHRIATEAMHMTRIEHLAKRVYTTLSGGERQRVQLARVLAQIWQDDGPRYLLLDEPTNNLDLAHQHGTLSIARRFAERGVGVLAVLHDLNLAAQYADRILVLREGRTFTEGTPSIVLTPENILGTFGLPALVQQHPCYNCPLVIPMPQPWGQPESFENQNREELVS